MESTGTQIREATLQDAARFTAFLDELFAESLPTLWREPTSGSMHGRLFLHGLVSHAGSVALLALDGEERVVGCLHFAGHRHPQRAHGGVLGVSVRREMRGQGIGTRLVEQLIEWAQRHELRRLELEVFGNNPRAEKLYERLGFVREGIRREAIDVEGERVDLVLMARLLVGSG